MSLNIEYFPMRMWGKIALRRGSFRVVSLFVVFERTIACTNPTGKEFKEKIRNSRIKKETKANEQVNAEDP